MSESSDDAFWARLSWILDQALVNLSPIDLAQRIEFCQRTGVQGVTASDEPGQDAVRFSWGGRPLVVVPRAVFAGPDAYLQGLEMTRQELSDAAQGDPREPSEQ